MTKPHTSWASIYDLVYEQSFGEFYNVFTDTTLTHIRNLLSPPARIIDYGAGTGRLSIPLSTYGYEVQAVEPCKEMLQQLSRKPGGSAVSVFIGKMEDFQTDTRFDMAICVFTVLLYLLDEVSLENSIQAVSNALRPGGLLLIDIPSKLIFQSFQKDTSIMRRRVTVLQGHDDIYQYEEKTTIYRNGQAEFYFDQFDIRHWNVEFVLKILSKYGFSISRDMSIEFSGTGSKYFLMRV